MAKFDNTDIEYLSKTFCKIYTLIELKRTAPYGGLLPVNYNKLLQAANLAVNHDGSAMLSKAISIAINTSSGTVKDSQNLYKNLDRLTAEPFPLLSGGKYTDPNNPKSKKIYRPLYDLGTGTYVQARYGFYSLTKLGKIATRHQKNQKMKDFTLHKSLVPLALLRKTVPWSPGHHSIMLPCCPAELFLIQYYQIKNLLETGSYELTDEQLSAAWKGIDVGENYDIYCTPLAAMGLYGAAQGSFTVIPKIEVNVKEKTVIIKAPIYESNATVTTDRVFRALQEDKFKTIKLVDGKTSVLSSDYETLIMNVKMVGTPQEIKRELANYKAIKRVYSLNNVVLYPKESTGLQSSNTIYQDEVEDYYVESVAIKDMLWDHVHMEFEERLREYNEEIEQIKREVDEAELMEMVSRPEVMEFIFDHAMDKDENGKLIAGDIIYKRWGVTRRRTPEEIEELKAKGEIDEDEVLPEGFTREEIGKIFEKVSTRSDKLGYLTAGRERESIEYIWEGISGQLLRLKELIALTKDNRKMLELIAKDCLEYAQCDEFQRKSDVHFVQEEAQSDICSMILPYNKSYEEYNLPVSIYYSVNYLCKSFGRNMNIPVSLSGEQSCLKEPTHVLNCTTKDKFYVIANSQVALITPQDVPDTGVDLEIQGIIPYSMDKEILLFTSHKTKKNFGEVDYGTRYTIVPKGGFTDNFTLDSNEYITAWCYIEDFEKDVYTLMCKDGQTKMGNHIDTGLIKFKSGTLPRTKPCELERLAGYYGTIQDVYIAKADQYINILSIITDTARLDSTLVKPYGYVPYEYKGTIAAMFSHHVEVYCDNIYIPWWADAKLVQAQNLPHTKLALLKEYIWLTGRDKTSAKIREAVLQKLSDLENVYIIKADYTNAYNNYKLSDLENWSLLDPRFQIPRERLEYQDYLDAADALYKQINEDGFSLKPRHIQKVKNYYRIALSSLRGIQYVENDEEVTEIDLVPKAETKLSDVLENTEIIESEDENVGEEVDEEIASDEDNIE